MSKEQDSLNETIEIPHKHPRAESLRIRENLIKHFKSGVVASAGLIAHGRGEAFDYILGENTGQPALKAIEAAAATLLTAEHPVISVNGNAAALAPNDIVELSKTTKAKIEVNLFYRSSKRELAIQKALEAAGATNVLGIGKAASARISEVGSERRRVDPTGILIADVVLVPLEDGDRTEALVRMGKKVIAIDLNPLSRTAQFATITIVDNIVRAIPILVEMTDKLKAKDKKKLAHIASTFDNKETLGDAIDLIHQRLSKLAKKGVYLPIPEGTEP
ncbi:MAG: 4-phosphopantoate--beta-alanine ligase [Candidatus Bathyarchaeota archaeon]|nr:4-phosphopantoate--beta-alanine ligase [Candidatus Bathyarchaeota archaeon]MDH5733708.1 4-phosphopantoate--beta-alanine ligase [Candidatus Bathyarchaeota archaeon]